MIAVLALLPGLGACATDLDRPVGPADLVPVEARPLQPQNGKLGEARLVEAFELRADDRRFGGFSGLALTDDRFYLLSDRGWLWWAERPARGETSLPKEWHVIELRVRGRRPDAEELAITADGRLAIAIEGPETLALFPGPERVHDIEVRNLPQAFRRRPLNEGIEALTTLADGSFLAISEGQTPSEGCYLAMHLAKAANEESCYAAAKGFRPTGAATMGSQLFVLERHLALFRFESRITTLSLDGRPPRLPPRLEGKEIARIDRAGLSENYEGIAVDPRSPEQVGIDLWLVSDDNFNAFQHTKLLHLRWKP